jgi:hypothetical protein
MNFVRRYGGPQAHAPWAFERVHTHRFILPADPGRLQAACDLILNYKPDVRFAPAVPFVTIEALHYAAMRPKRPKADPKPGCGMSQHELTVRMTVTASDAHGQGLGLFDFCPFIYVDNAWSVILGREAIGYPKLLAEFALHGAGLDGNPLALEVTTQLCTDGRGDWSHEPILRADYSQAWPSPLPAWQELEELAEWDLTLNLADQLGIRPDCTPTLAEADRQIRALTASGGVGAIQLKQFLDPVNGRPDYLACYKALVKGTIVSTRIRGTGISTRPVRLTFYEYPEFEIGRFLGVLAPSGPDTIEVPLWWKIYLDFEGDVTGYL